MRQRGTCLCINPEQARVFCDRLHDFNTTVWIACAQ
jgi:hypothetical protein